MTRLPRELRENSGIESTSSDGTVWAINDSGNNNSLYKVGRDGSLLREISIRHSENTDWEELTKDRDNNLYIGDFGNNDNKRKDLAIYKVSDVNNIHGNTAQAEKITFEYPEQKDFPPKKKHRYFDAEAFFHSGGYFYLFTKNRSKPFDGVCYLYKIPAVPGHHLAERIGEYTFCKDKDRCRITAAAISPDGKTAALLGHENIWLFSGFENDNIFKATRKENIALEHYSQKEGLCFTDNHTLLVSDEEEGSSGRNLYEFRLPED
ncbi:hypothetical protein DN748_10600 [Sinomicrobium soli]|nr:hypothetical protein DN748_10600 [Sinomicrobium sp. N-1-3-6]